MQLESGVCSLRNADGNTFTVGIAGDFCPTHAKRIQQKIADGGTDSILGDLKPVIGSCDLRLIQFETPLTEHGVPIPKSGPNLNADPVCAAFARPFNVALLANNHTGDQGPAASLETMTHLHCAGLRTVGAGTDLADAVKPLTLNVNGLSVEIINVAEREFGHARENAAGVAPLDPFENIRMIRQAKSDGKFVLIVCHGGHEYYPFPSVRMQKTFRAFADAGADIVVNIHTHCPLGTEVWNGTPIVYSTGNLFFPIEDEEDRSWALPSWFFGYLPKFYCDRQGVYAFELIPYFFDRDRIHRMQGPDEMAFFDWLNVLSAKIGDLSALTEYFKIWTAKIGREHVDVLKDRLTYFPAVLSDDSLMRQFIACRNLYTCESHVDLIREYLVLIEEGTLSRYESRWAELDGIRRPAFAEKFRLP